jgi:hypothetical protein
VQGQPGRPDAAITDRIARAVLLVSHWLPPALEPALALARQGPCPLGGCPAAARGKVPKFHKNFTVYAVVARAWLGQGALRTQAGRRSGVPAALAWITPRFFRLPCTAQLVGAQRAGWWAEVVILQWELGA